MRHPDASTGTVAQSSPQGTASSRERYNTFDCGCKAGVRRAAIILFVPCYATMRLALFQPDIPQNAGTLMRLGACLGVAIDIIEPCGFVLSDRRLRRAGLDYIARAQVSRHESWEAFCAAQNRDARLVLLTTHGTMPYHRFAFGPADIILVGRETAGVPETVHRAVAARLVVPMQPDRRSLNVAIAAAMVLGEALRQTSLLPGDAT
jgi:tRNA (cytidine/uridine-2'-O-)-methyltransferase